MKYALAIIGLMVFVILFSGCLFFSDKQKEVMKIREKGNKSYQLGQDVDNYLLQQGEGENIKSNKSKIIGVLRIKNASYRISGNTAEVKIVIEDSGHVWNGTWSYNGTNWNPNPDFRIIS